MMKKRRFADGGNITTAPMPPQPAGPQSTVTNPPNPMQLMPQPQQTPQPASPQPAYPPPPMPGMTRPFKRGGKVKKFSKGGSVKGGASRRGDGIASKGKTRA